MTQKPRIAILHDAFLYRGGGERLVTLMAKALDADLVSGFFSEGSFDPRELGFTGKMIALGKPVFAKGIRHMILKWRFFWKAGILREYDIVIFSGDCLGALRHIDASESKVFYYCHTPPRYLYDFKEKYLAKYPLGIRFFMSHIFSFFSKIYEKNLDTFDTIFTNSQNVHDRLLHYTGKESEIIYPPTDTDFFTPSQHGYVHDIPFESKDYFYSWARLSPPKRVDTIVDAFIDMPDKNLAISYGKNDPQKDMILEKIKGKKNIFALEAPSDEVLISLIRGSLATIYIPVDEDFGMSPVESMACGTPVIGVNEGGLRETIIDGKTGRLIDSTSDESLLIHLQAIIQETSKEAWNNMKDDCMARSQFFSLEKFQEKLQSSLDAQS